MKSLATLIKLQKQKVDEQRVVLAKMHDHLAGIVRQINSLKQEMSEQIKVLHEDPACGFTFGAYLTAARERLDDLERRRRIAEQAVHMALEKLAELFEEQKRYEIADTNRKIKIKKEEDHKETQILDEVGSVSFTRRQKAQK